MKTPIVDFWISLQDEDVYLERRGRGLCSSQSEAAYATFSPFKGEESPIDFWYLTILNRSIWVGAGGGGSHQQPAALRMQEGQWDGRCLGLPGGRSFLSERSSVSKGLSKGL